MASWMVGLVDASSASVGYGELQDYAAALQAQLDDDFAPAWGVHAAVTALRRGRTVPGNVWPIKLVDEIEGAGGVHLDDGGLPYAEAVVGPDLTVAISHELLEMLVDPWGNRFTPGPSIDPAAHGRTVFFLVEVGDPCEVTTYPVRGVSVSDFVLPAYYEPHAGNAVDLRGALSRSFEVAAGGYISWIDPFDGRWHQQQTDGSFVTASSTVAPGANPRDERDRVFGRHRTVG